MIHDESPFSCSTVYRANVLLAYTYIDKHAEAVRCSKEHFEFKDGCTVHIPRLQAHPPVQEETPEPKVIQKRRKTKDFDSIPVVRLISIPPRSEIMTPVTVGRPELRLAEGREELCAKKRLPFGNVVANVHPT